MKIRNGFISNSSSTSFLITNKTNKKKTIVDFVIENRHLIDVFNYEYSSEKVELGTVISDAEKLNIIFKSKETKECVFGDEDGTDIGKCFDYILRNGGESNSFSWKFKEYLR